MCVFIKGFNNAVGTQHAHLIEIDAHTRTQDQV